MERLPVVVLDDLYAAFSHAPHPTIIEGCPCCVDSKNISVLISTPLCQIDLQDLAPYASSVFLTVGAAADFRYFLPRILEVLAITPGWWPQPEIVGRAIANIPWGQNTRAQQRALASYFDTVFEVLLNHSELDGSEVDSWLCCASHVLPDWENLLENLLARPKVLVVLYGWHSGALQKRRLGSGFWNDSPRHDEFLAWLLSDQVRAALWTEWGL